MTHQFFLDCQNVSSWKSYHSNNQKELKIFLQIWVFIDILLYLLHHVIKVDWNCKVNKIHKIPKKAILCLNWTWKFLAQSHTNGFDDSKCTGTLIVTKLNYLDFMNNINCEDMKHHATVQTERDGTTAVVKKSLRNC